MTTCEHLKKLRENAQADLDRIVQMQIDNSCGSIRSLQLIADSTQYANMGSHQIENTDTFTFSVLVFPTDKDQTIMQLFSNLDTSGSVPVGYQIYLYNRKLLVDFRGAGGGRTEWQSANALPANTWTRVTIVKAGAGSSAITVYFGSVVQSPDSTTDTISGTSINSKNTLLGNRPDLPTSQNFDGNVDQAFKAMGYALSSTEVAEADGGGASFDLSMLSYYSTKVTNYYPIGESADTATVLTDLKGSVNGTIVNGAAYSLNIA